MSYIDHALQIYDSLNKIDFSDLKSPENLYPTLYSNINGLSSYKKLKNGFLKYSKDLLVSKLEFSDASFEIINSVLNNENLDEAITNHILFFLFWIWHNEVEMSNEKLKELTGPIYSGIIGYSILDYFTDEEKYGKELIYLSFEIIRIAEQLYENIFNDLNTRKIFNRHASNFANVEFTEKRNLWKKCPFSWNESWQLGLKASPSFSVYEILFNHIGMHKDKIEDLISGMTFMTAGIQLMDDLSDAKNDLKNGIETLVMKGFYSNHGTNPDFEQKLIFDFLSEEKVEIIFSNGIELFNKAKSLFEKHEDEILLLYNEIQRVRFKGIFEFSEIN